MDVGLRAFSQPFPFLSSSLLQLLETVLFLFFKRIKTVHDTARGREKNALPLAPTSCVIHRAVTDQGLIH